MEKIVSLCKRRGFIFQSSGIYGGLGSVWDYGPLGVELKRNVKEAWWRSNVYERDDMEGMDAAILINSAVLMASLFWGSNFIPARASKPGNGIIFQPIMCCGIAFVAFENDTVSWF